MDGSRNPKATRLIDIASGGLPSVARTLVREGPEPADVGHITLGEELSSQYVWTQDHTHRKQYAAWNPEYEDITKTNDSQWTSGCDCATSPKQNDIHVCLYYVPMPDNGCSKISELITGLQKNKQLTYFDFERDFRPNKSLLHEIGYFLHTTKRTILVLSPLFYASNFHMYVLETTVSYCIDNRLDAIICLLVDTSPSEIPKCLSVFSYIDTKDDGWFVKLVRQLNVKGHISMDDVETLRSVHSDPPTIRRPLPENVKLQLQTWFRSKSMHPKINATETNSPGRNQIGDKQATMDNNVIFARELRREMKDVYESSEQFKTESLNIAEGDVLEVLDGAKFGDEKALIRNSQGQTGHIPYRLLTPSLFPLPSSAVKLLNQPISKSNNKEFRERLEKMGLKVHVAVESFHGNTGLIKVNKNDILLKISQTENQVKVKNYQNVIGYIEEKLIRNLSSNATWFV
ncbi:uncharacterized protein LOC126810858 isoform X2 [Patella vulgata]|uniref:uncharacterized protein LOC126810858 isoform X2 n=1 Tax=Patella vulgata TaxID=6465 RepID=UPI00217FB4D4|nr:uncharacterized protein LOC126810858 isoform X2 [Patella vulgata]